MTESDTQPTAGGELAVPPSGAAYLHGRTRKDLAQLERDIAHYPDPVRVETRWLQGFYLDHCNGSTQTLRGIAAKLGHDKSAEYFRNLICGDYFTSKPTTWAKDGHAWAGFTKLMESLRRYAQQAARTGQMPFIQTPTYRCISNFITAKRALSAVCRIGGIIASTGGQTSECFKFYRALNNHGAVVHLEAPASGRLSALQIKIAEQYHATANRVARMAATREQAIRENVNETRCLIIDNCQVLFDRRRGTDQPCFNWLRELYDDRRPTIILKFTKEFLNDMTSAEARVYFEQFIGRMGGLNSLLKLPEYAPASDLKCIARSFKLADSAIKDYLEPWSRSPGRIRIVFEKLQLAQRFAQLDKRDRITLDDLADADAFVPPAEGSDDDEGGEL